MASLLMGCAASLTWMGVVELVTTITHCPVANAASMTCSKALRKMPKRHTVIFMDPWAVGANLLKNFTKIGKDHKIMTDLTNVLPPVVTQPLLEATEAKAKSKGKSKPKDVPTITSAATSKGNVYRVPPESIGMPKEMNGRKYGVGDVQDLAMDMLANGQLQPIGVRQTKDGPAVAYGFRRLAAALEINEMGLAKEPFLISCITVKGNDDDAFVQNVAENIQRQSTSPIDDAYNIDRLATEFGKTREEIGKLYGTGGKPRSASWISRTLKLLTLPPDIQKKIHKGEIGVAASYELADADPETQKEVMKSSKGGKSPTAESVKEAKREAQEQEESKPASERNPKTPAKSKRGRKAKENKRRSRKEVQTFFTQVSELWHEVERDGETKLFELFPDAKQIDPDGQAKELGKQLLAWLDGKGTNRTMARDLLRFGALVD